MRRLLDRLFPTKEKKIERHMLALKDLMVEVGSTNLNAEIELTNKDGRSVKVYMATRLSFAPIYFEEDYE